MDMNPIFAHMHANTFLLFSTWKPKIIHGLPNIFT